jgi:protein-L-isoaspartate(D-aspartate) O-methyltransferase
MRLENAAWPVVLLASVGPTSCDRSADRSDRSVSEVARQPEQPPGTADHAGFAGTPPPDIPDTAVMASERRALIATLIEGGIKDARVLHAVAKVPRHELVPARLRAQAYVDHPLPIGEGQTISQPHVVALMTELAHIDPGDRVLEVGTGSGYQAAILAELTDRVHTIEIVAPLAARARHDLERLGYRERIRFRIGDGYAGWADAAPFDAIIVTAAPPTIPAPLKAQLAIGGRLVIPVGEQHQDLRVIERTSDGFVEHESIAVRFVPMTGRAQER